jgi:hypothetical protein
MVKLKFSFKSDTNTMYNLIGASTVPYSNYIRKGGLFKANNKFLLIY